MLVASDNALATPESGDQLLNSLPIGASRTLEGERLREAREHDLMLTIMQIDGVEGARVHLAEPENSVFVRENTPPSASVMIRLAHGRHLTDSQVQAITNLVASSVPGLSPDAVRVVDQAGQLLTGHDGGRQRPAQAPGAARGQAARPGFCPAHADAGSGQLFDPDPGRSRSRPGDLGQGELRQGRRGAQRDPAGLAAGKPARRRGHSRGAEQYAAACRHPERRAAAARRQCRSGHTGAGQQRHQQLEDL